MGVNTVYKIGMVIACFTFHFIIIGLQLSFGILYSELHEEFDVPQAHAAWMVSLFTGTIGVTGVPVGHYVSRFGERRLAVIGSLLLFVGMLTSSFVTSFSWFYVTYGLIAGLGASISLIPSIMIIMKTYTKGRPLAVALGNSGAAFGNLALPPLLSHMISGYGWRGTFLLLSGLALQCLPASLLLVSNVEDETTHDTNSNQDAPNTNQKSFKHSTAVICKNPKFVFFASSSAACFVVIFAPSIFLPDLMKELSMTDSEIYIVVMVIGIGNLLGRLWTGLLERCIRLDLLNVFVAVLFAGAVSSTTLLVVRSFVVLIVVSVIIGFVIGASICLHILIVAQLLDKEYSDIGFGWVSCLNGIAVIVGIPLAGLMVDIFGTVTAAYPFIGAFMFLSLVLSLVTKLVFYLEGRKSYTVT